MTIVRALLLVFLACGSAVFAEEKAVPWAKHPDFRVLVHKELKQFNKLLSEALKEDYRRQAIYLARRIAKLKPEDERAQSVLTQWSGKDFDTPAPKDKFVSKMTSELKKLGTAYFNFGEQLERQGVDPETYNPINVQALTYGCDANVLVSTIREAGFLWMQTFPYTRTDEVKEIIGSTLYEVTFPVHWDDDFLRVNVHWPESQVAALRNWRVVTDCKPKDAMRVVRALDELEGYVTERMKGKAPKKPSTINIAVCAKKDTYPDLVSVLLPERSADTANKVSAYYSRWRRTALACWEHRDNKWIKGERLALGAAARSIVRTHLAKGGGSVRGKGAWLLDGFAGAMEALDWSERGFTHVNPKLSLRLLAARKLRDQGKLMDWERFLDLDAAKADLVERATVRFNYKGSAREMKNVDVAAAQATAFVIGLLKADPKRGPKRVGKLLGELVKRDSLPDIDKTMGWKKGRAVKEAERALDAVGS